jgi:hypothetical protein
VRGRRVKEIGFQQRLTFDHQCIAAIRQVNRTRRSVAILRWDTVGPALWRHLEMSIGGQQLVLPGH